MKWSFPAKTFLIGEYAALANRGAIILTTKPCFELCLTDKPELRGIHPDSPAGVLWNNAGFTNLGLSWFDPYHGCGGLGASSAQFLGAYNAICFLQQRPVFREEFLKAYWECAWNGQGLRPSGYDVVAQSLSGCVYINRLEERYQVLSWPFDDLEFILVHTGNKLATHHHLQNTPVFPDKSSIDELNEVVNQALDGFKAANQSTLINAINNYHRTLVKLNLVAHSTKALIEQLSQREEIHAIKGCGALGADVLLLLSDKKYITTTLKRLAEMNLKNIATSQSLTPHDN